MPDTNLSHDPTRSAIAKAIEWSVRNAFLVVVLAIALAVSGLLALRHIPLDAIPDLSDTQVIIRTEFPGQSPQIVEDLVTYPLSTTMLGLPGSKDVRGFSMFGTSFVVIVFEDSIEQYWARSRVVEALSKIQGDLPSTAIPRIGPDATGVGWVFQYALVDHSNSYDLAQLRSLQDWFLKYELATVPGVSEVASVGGFVKEYQIMVDPNRLRAFNIHLPRIRNVLATASKEVGGRVLEQGETEYIIRSKGYVSGVEDLRNTVIKAQNGTAVLLSDVARIIEGPALRRGITELNGEGEVVGGFVVMRSGENALTVINAVKEKLESLKPSLPEGVEIIPVYDRAPLIEGAISYLYSKLLQEGIVVMLVTLLFLLHARSALVAIITLPLGVLAAFIVMSAQGITANIMSLGGIAIAIGAMVDASIVMVENAHRKLSELPGNADKNQKRAAMLLAMKEVGPGLFFSLLIITISFLPVFALTGQSFRLFSPLAYTKTYAMAFAAILSITIVPVLMVWLIRGTLRHENENLINRWFIRLYQPLLARALRYPGTTLLIAMVLALSTALPLLRTGSEFMPPLYEGDLLYMPTTLPGVSVTTAKAILAQTNRLIKTMPEVTLVFGKVGRTDSATDPAPISMIETWIRLKPRENWRDGLTPEDLINELNARVQLPGLVNSWGYPIKIRIDMVSTGIRTPVGIKISGDNLQEIEQAARDVEAMVGTIPGTRSAFADRVTGGKYLNITPNRKKLARHNIEMGLFQQIIQTALGGIKISESVEGRERYAIMLRYDRPFREHPEDLKQILIPTDHGAHIPLGELATISFDEGPAMIKSENARLNGWVFVDIAGRSLGDYVSEARKTIRQRLPLPPGISIEWSGQYTQMLEARDRLSLAIPATIFSIFILLMLHFGRLDRTLMVMLSLPFGLIGGMWAIYLAGYHFSVATSVGFIALAGIAAETAVVMLLYLDQQARHHPPTTPSELVTIVMHGAVLRIRPKLMTVSVIILGLLPIFLTEGPGSDVMRRIALPMVGGMISTTLLTLLLIPVIYYIWERRKRIASYE